MRSMRIGLDLSWPRVTAVLLLDVAVLAAATNWPGEPRGVRIAGWVLAAVLAIAACVTYRGLPLGAVPATWLRNQLGAQRHWCDPAAVTAVDHRHRYGRGAVGIRELDAHLLSVIAVTGAPESSLPIATVAAGFGQFDVRLEGIDVLWLTGSAVPADRTWVVVRMDARANLAAVVLRDSVAATLAAATERVAEHLHGDGRTTRILTADEITDVDTAVLAGLEPAAARLRLGRVEHGGPDGAETQVYSGWLAPGDIDPTLPERIRRSGAEVSVLRVALVPAGTGLRVSALLRQHVEGAPPEQPGLQLHRAFGRQLAAITASRPVPCARPAAVPAAVHPDGAAALTLPLAAAADAGAGR